MPLNDVIDTSPQPGWHPADIIAAVSKGGANLAALGRRIGLSRKSMSWALKKRHPRANLAIADFIGVPAHELWPLWYPPTSTTPESSGEHSAPAVSESRTSSTKKKAA